MKIVGFNLIDIKFRIDQLSSVLNCKIVGGYSFLAGTGFQIALTIAPLGFCDDGLNTAKMGVLDNPSTSAIPGTRLCL